MWPFLNSSQQSASQVMTLPLTQATTTLQNNNNNNQNLAHNFDINLFAAAAALQHQQQQQQQQLHQHHHHLQQQQQQQQRKLNANSFTSPFSVNSLLAPFVSSTLPQTQNHTKNLIAQNASTQQQQQQQQHQLAAAVFTQHIAAAVANYRLQQQQKFHQQQHQQQSQEPTLCMPPNKKYKTENTNYETYSIASPSSSSSSSSSSLSSTTNSICDFNHELTNNLDNNNKMSNHRSQQHSDSNSTSLSSSLLNDSLNYDQSNEQKNDRYTPDTLKNSSFVRRSSRKRNSIDLQNPCCPLCGLSLRLNDLQAHIDLELEKLEKISNNLNSSNVQNNNNTTINNDLPLNQLINISNNFPNNRKRTSSGSDRILSCSSSSSLSISHHQNEPNFKSRFLNYLKIKENRQLRLKSKLRIRVRESSNGSLICPICIEPLKGNKNEINLHLENCSSSRANSSSDGEKDIDIETTGPSTSSIHEVYEEYEWAGHKRIRTISLLNNPAKELDAVNVKNEEYDGELNVDSDDRVISYGKSQFNESDIIPMPTEDSSVEIIRKAIIGDNENKNNNSSNELNDSNSNETNNNDNITNINDSNCITTKNVATNIKNDNSKCLICMEPYTNALVSINCWHVYCKQCWLQSLGVKKLCPQCNVITTAEDLRRIFL